jgi:cytidylate kinase
MRNAELDTLIDERVAEALTAQNLQVIIDQRVAAALAPPPQGNRI